MYAVLGFGVAGVLFLIFALSFNKKIVKDLKLPLNDFAYAYAFVAAAFFGWAMAPIFGSRDVLVTSLVIGNALFLIATILILRCLVPVKKQHFITNVATLIAASLFAIRIFSTNLDPYMDQGMLIFRSSPLVSVILAFLVLAIWLPANIKVAKKIAGAKKTPELSTTYILVYSLAALSLFGFNLTGNRVSIAVAYLLITVVYSILIWLNYSEKPKITTA
jgi:hypothetical protein